MKTFSASLSALLLTLIVLPAMAGNTVRVNAADLIGKVYGVADPNVSENDCRRQASEALQMIPTLDEGAEWISSDNGYVLVYEGLSPEVEAMALYDRGEVAGYGYIFYFPYEAKERETANTHQCEFCSALLQELTDMGMALGSDSESDSLFDVEGVFSGGDVRLTLREEVESETVTPYLQSGIIPVDRQGQFILMINVVPSNVIGLTAQAGE